MAHDREAENGGCPLGDTLYKDGDGRQITDDGDLEARLPEATFPRQ